MLSGGRLRRGGALGEAVDHRRVGGVGGGDVELVGRLLGGLPGVAFEAEEVRPGHLAAFCVVLQR
jgi:hypothetical protein